MQLHKNTLFGLLIALTSFVHAKSWSFEDATASIQTKGAAVGSSTKHKLKPNAPLSSPITLGYLDTLKLELKATEDKTASRPHQAFLTLRDSQSGLEDSFPLKVKSSGSGSVDITQKDIPLQLLASENPLRASITLGSFGAATPLDTHAFNLKINLDPSKPLNLPEPPVRYGKREEIHHIFRADPQSPPKMITLVFVAMALATLPALGIAWLALGANLSHLSDALSNAPLSHAMFVGSILALEGIFFMYYTSWKLFQMLPAAGVAGTVAFLSGSKALSEVQSRRLAGKR